MHGHRKKDTAYVIENKYMKNEKAVEKGRWIRVWRIMPGACRQHGT